MRELALLPTVQEFETMKSMASMAIKSGLLPSSISKPETALIIIMKGREIGMAPMQALEQICVINGKAALTSQGMLSQIYKHIPMASIYFEESNNTVCRIRAARPGQKESIFKFSLEDAKTANLLGKGPWKSYPDAMLRARAISAMARALFPDALNGISYTPEELGADVEIDEEGNELLKDVSLQKENHQQFSDGPFTVPEDNVVITGQVMMSDGTTENISVDPKKEPNNPYVKLLKPQITPEKAGEFEIQVPGSSYNGSLINNIPVWEFEKWFYQSLRPKLKNKEIQMTEKIGELIECGEIWIKANKK